MNRKNTTKPDGIVIEPLITLDDFDITELILFRYYKITEINIKQW